MTVRSKMIELENVSVEFETKSGVFAHSGTIRAVDSVSLSVMKGETLGLIGESGSGKSTLGRAALRLAPLAGGTVRYNGVDLSSLAAADLRGLRSKMQIVFQDPNASLDPRMTVGEILSEPLEIHTSLDAAARTSLIVRTLEKCGLRGDDLEKHPHRFSGGQKQRIAIARALVLNPDFIVLDEPVSALDLSIQAQILNLLIDLKRERGLTYLFITHDIGVLAHLCDRIAVMYFGRIVEIGTDLTVSARHPYTKMLLEAAPEIGRGGDGSKRMNVTGEPPSVFAPPSGCAFRSRCPLADSECAADAPPLENGVACFKV